MISSVSTAIPSFIILILFLACFFSAPRIPILTNRLYILLLFATLVTAAMNILASYANRNFSVDRFIVTYIFNTLFFVALLVRSYLFFAYSASLVNLNHYNTRMFAWVFRLPMIITAVVAVTSFKTKALFRITDAGFEKGPFMYLLYMCLYFYLIVSVFAIIIHKKNFSGARDFWGAIAFNVFLASGSLYVSVFPTSLMIDTFCLMSVIVIFLCFENPDFRTEARTGLFNGNALHDYLQEMHYKKNILLLAFVIKNYQDIREIYGIPSMDTGIRLIGNYLKTSYPEITSFYFKEGRFILSADADTDADELCKSIAERFENSWDAKGVELYLNICFARMDPGTDLSSADLTLNALISAMNRAVKSDDGFVAVVGDKDITDYIKEISVKKILELTVEENLIEVFLQPIVETAHLRIVGAEALARIRDREGRFISPEDFIPIAEKNGCITTLGEQILDKTCKFIKENSLDSIGLSWINVNLSPIQFFVNDIAASYEEIIRRNGLDYNIIRLEITEESMVSHSLLLKQMESMTEKGFQFVLDDYGKGYSNLSRLHKCPFVNIKIDMELVWAYCNNPNLLLPSMISSFKSMGFTVTAEGIENREMADAMIALGCDYLQGYYFSKPLSMPDFTKAFAIFA
ncbi:MAG: EAL domain-containing protein [Lachnospiraceae bacterium]|nr:EAL domain-containing protein [Lachnospiraceae bacterium]